MAVVERSTTTTSPTFEPVTPSPGLQSLSLLASPGLSEKDVSFLEKQVESPAGSLSMVAQASPVDSITDALDDVRLRSSEVIERLCGDLNRLQTEVSSQAKESAITRVKEELQRFEQVYSAMVEGEMQRYKDLVDDAKAAENDDQLEATYDALKDFLFETVQGLESWEAHKIDFAGLHDLLSKVWQSLDDGEIDSALVFDKFTHGIRIWRENRDLADLDVLRTLPRGQDAALAKRFIVLEEIGAQLDGTMAAEAEPCDAPGPHYRQIEQLIDDQLVCFAFLLKKKEGEAAKALRDRLVTFLEIETEVFREIYQVEEDFWKKLDNLANALKAEEGGSIEALLAYTAGKEGNL